MAVLSTQLQAGPTIQLNGDELRDGMADSGSLGYVGGNTRVGVSINRELEGQVDLNQIIMEDDSSATSAEGWFGYKLKDDENRSQGLTGGGVKLNHQWVNDQQDTVHKVFGAYDQDVNDRAKATVGYGQETEDLFWSGHVSKSIADEKIEHGIATRAYDYGVGAQVGTFLDSTLTRIRGGLDYEFGTEFADGEDRPGKATISAGVEQFFHDSPHSITLDVSGNQVSGGNDAENTDFGARLGYRYEFGGDGVYRSANRVSRRRVEIPGQPGRPGRAGVPAIPPTRGTPGRAAVPGRAAIPGRPAIPGRAAIPGRPGRAAIPGRPGRAAIPPRYERRAVNAPGHEFVKTTMKLENETFFKLNSSKLTQSAQRNLDKIVGQIRGHGYLGAIRITGNTCGLGDPAYDQRLSESRANAVRDYLVDKGFNPSHLVARGLGKGSPKYDRRDDDFRNRRVDLEYVTERTVKKAANKTQYRNVLVQEGRPAVAAIPGRPAIPAQPGRPAQPYRPAQPGRAAVPGRPGIPARAGHPGRPAIPAIPATPGTPSRFIWKTEVVPSAPVWIQRAIRNTISHNKSISTYTTRVSTKTVDDTFTATNRDNIIDVLANDGTGLTLVRVTQPENGTVSIVNGKVVYVPNPGFSGTDTFTYTVVDADGNELTSRVTVDVPVAIAVNNAPMAVDDSANTNQATPVAIDVLLNDSDSDGDAITIGNISNPANGTVQLLNAQIVYTPNANFTGTDTFTYTITDGNNNQSTATVNVVVEDVNQAPIAVNDNSTTPEATPVTINVISNDSDADGDALTVITLGQPGNGSVAIVNNQVVYTPNAGFIGVDSFTYVVSDNNGNSTTATVSVNVTNVNKVPTAVDDTRTTPENTPVTIPVLANDSDTDGDTLSIVSATNPANGSVSVVNSDIVYTPNNGFSGQDTFDYTITDGNGNNVTATVTVNVTDVKMAPNAVNDAETTDENTSVTINVLSNDSDPDGDTLSLVSNTTPGNGTAVISGGNIVYTPAVGFTGVDTFNYTITDTDGNNVTAMVTVTVNDVNYPPAASNDNDTTPENTPVTISVLGNDGDIDGDTITITNVSATSNGGSATISGNNIIYTPANGFVGTDTFTYTINDGNGNSVTATVTVVVTAVNKDPIAVDDSASTPLNTSVTINVAANDTDPDGTATCVNNIVSNPSNGVVSISGSTDLVYTPNAGFTGTDTFVYTACDANGGTDTATVTVTVGMANQPPVAWNNSATTPVNTPVTMGPVNNDVDPDGDTLTIVSTTNPANGSINVTGNTVVYTPNPGYVGTDSYTYTISDGNGNTDTATVTVTVVAVNQPPKLTDDNATTPSNTAITMDVTNNDTDPEGDTLTVVSTTNPSNGTVSVTGNNVVYTPNSGYVGVDSYTYTVNDGNGNSATATATVTITSTNQNPIAVDDSAMTPYQTPVTINVAANDSDPDGTTTCVSNIASPPSNGSAIIGTNGTDITYTPNAGFTGTDTFVYTACDAMGGSDTATVTVVVGAANQPPVLTADEVTTPFDTAITIGVTGNDTDPDNDTLTVTGTSGGHNNATITFSGGNVIYTPSSGFVGVDNFYYTVTDSNGHTVTSTVRVEVLAATTSVNAVADTYDTDHDTSVWMHVMSNDNNPEGTAMNICNIVSGPSNGTAVISATQPHITYTPNSGYSGMDTLTYQLCDVEGDTDTAQITVNVGAKSLRPAARSASGTSTNSSPVIASIPAMTANASGATIDLAGYFSDAEGDSVYIAIADALKGNVNFSGTVLQYTPNASAVGSGGTDSIYITVSDGRGGMADGTITVYLP